METRISLTIILSLNLFMFSQCISSNVQENRMWNILLVEGWLGLARRHNQLEQCQSCWIRTNGYLATLKAINPFISDSDDLQIDGIEIHKIFHNQNNIPAWKVGDYVSVEGRFKKINLESGNKIFLVLQ